MFWKWRAQKSEACLEMNLDSPDYRTRYPRTALPEGESKMPLMLDFNELVNMDETRLK
jgi:hypothetical protein